HTSYSSMGCDISDINNDALPDIAVLDMQASDHVRAKTNMPAMSSATFWQNVQKGYGYQYMSNVLQLNNGYGFFSEIGQLAGIAKTDWSWSVLLADFDHDRLNDMYVTNGVNRDMRNSDLVEQMEQVPPSRRAATDLFELAKTFPSQAIPNHLFQNQGDLTFADVTDHWGLAYPGFSFGAAYGDLDGDGDLDLVTCNANDVAHIFRNDTPPRHYLQIVLRGSADNPFALGSTARIFDKMGSQIRSLTLTRGYQSSVEPLLHFGLGEVELVDSLHVVFPDGRTYQTYNIRADQRLEISHADARVRGLQLPADRPVTFSNMTDSLGLRFLHRENRFNDFTRETLLPHMQSRNGPFIATGDLNGDGHADFFIGGAAGQPGQIFLQQADGTFRPERVADLAADAAFEDMGSVIADLNGDGANDLFVVSGGNEYPEGSPAYQDRLYLNDGRGHLARAPARLPRIATNGSCVRARDFEGDGDTDLFVGHRGIPGAYPRAGGSLLLVNQNGVFVDQTEMLAPALVNAGMVTDAAWSDVDSDGDADLLVVGEWMSPQVFVQESGRWFQQTGHVLAEDLTGWWFSIKTMDIDRDGDDDYILGNMGLNNKYHPTPERPLNIYARDFDGNNTNDIVLARLTQYGEVPVRGRECSSEQMPFIADKFPDYQSFARATLQDIYGDALSGSVRIQAREFRSGVLINDPPGRLTFMPFPNQAQIAPVQAAIEVELNGDGHPDLLLAGNHFDAEVETVRHDASNGLVLLGNGDGTFEPLAVWQTLFYVPFNTKDMALLRTATGRPVVLTANNNFQLMAFSYQ
ncbi:MAG: FG-GAP-like repeat-containing protein, partial [Saprospiraceae bacterium]|nr:FG-GAP-like repeat-containing protein [Saprospiraceae bacterium]